jgi:hypothetical protein
LQPVPTVNAVRTAADFGLITLDRSDRTPSALAIRRPLSFHLPIKVRMHRHKWKKPSQFGRQGQRETLKTPDRPLHLICLQTVDFPAIFACFQMGKISCIVLVAPLIFIKWEIYG